MILVDTSVWIDHLRHGDDELVEQLEIGQVLAHPFVIGELACGNLSNRIDILRLMGDLPQAPSASQEEVLMLIEKNVLMGRGLGFIDVHLVAATLFANGSSLWTRDKRLQNVADELHLSYTPISN